MKKTLLPLAAMLLLVGCGGGDAVTMVRLVDVFNPDSVEGAPAAGEAAPQALWDFAQAGDDATLGWRAGSGVADLRVVDGKLTGRATTDFPIIYAPRPETADTADSFHSLQVRAMVTDGAEVRAHLVNSEEPDFANLQVVSDDNWRMEGRVSGDEIQAVTLSSPLLRRLANVKTILLRPTDKSGSTFEIESIRMLSQREHLASIPSGIGWQGLDEVYRETLVSRSPESFTIDVDIPANSWLDLHVGTVEDAPVTFVVADVTNGSDTLLLERTVTTKDAWDLASTDLSSLTGSRRLRFSLDAEGDRMVGYWGSPAIRVRGARPAAPAKESATVLGSPAPPQGVILIMIDTLRKDHTSLYGYERDTTPTLSKMASEGVLFLDNISQATWTKVATPSIMTSLYPQSHRVHDIPDTLAAAGETIAEVYRAGGYATASFASNAFTGRATNLHQGFEEVHEAGSLHNQGTKTSRPVVDGAVDWLERHADTPYFMYLHLYDPHSKFEPRAPYNTMWADATGKEEHEAQRKKALDYAKAKDETRQFNELPNAEDLEAAGTDVAAWMAYEKAWYDGSIRGMDAELARLLERLRSLGIARETLIAVVSDHGEELHDHGKFGHGFQAYGEIANVTMLLHRPGSIPERVRVEETTRSIDLMPTLLNLSGLPVPEAAQGRSTLPLIAGYLDGRTGDEASATAAELGWETRPAVTEEHKRVHSNAYEVENDDESFAIVFEGWKLIHNTITKKKPEFELFDHANDPLDAHDVADANPEMVEKLKTELSYWRREVTDAALPEDSSEGMSSEELEKLRSLGYIQ
ncbi:MAG: sulfatase [Acidobacteria bacterium]|nr:sulfatase [Acidobacteriota bacterium]